MPQAPPQEKWQALGPLLRSCIACCARGQLAHTSRGTNSPLMIACCVCNKLAHDSSCLPFGKKPAQLGMIGCAGMCWGAMPQAPPHEKWPALGPLLRSYIARCACKQLARVSHCQHCVVARIHHNEQVPISVGIQSPKRHH
jgi:hypothetical protein